MRRRIYTVVICVLIVMIILLLGAMAYIGWTLLNAPPTDVLPERAEAPQLLTSEDFEPDRELLYQQVDGVLMDAQGREVKLSALRGKPVVLLFWSSWCGDCKAYLTDGLEDAARAARESGALFHLVCREGVRDDTRQAAEETLGLYGLTEETLMDPDAALYKSLGLHSVPSIAVLDRQGRLMYSSTEMPDAAAMTALVAYAEDPQGQTQRFLTDHLVDASGLLLSGYRVRNGAVVPGDTALSEGQGLMMLWAAQADDQVTFDRIWQAVQDSASRNGLTAWRVVSGEAAEVNASLDDLRIVEALAAADARWGMYESAARQRAHALYDACVRLGLMRDFASLDGQSISESVTMCYMDVAAMRQAAVYDPRWTEAADRAQALLSDPESLISEALPLYHTRYDAASQTFTGDTVQMNEAAVAVLNAARAGAVFPQTLDWLEAALAAGPVYASYGADGRVLPGYRYESNATYALLVQIGVATGREDLTRMALERMERRRSFDAPMVGGYGSAENIEHFTFDELEALLAWQAAYR